MENKQITYSPYIRTKDNVTKVMLDVIIALTPIVGISYLVYGITPVLVILAAVMGAVVAEVIFSTIFYKKPNSVLDLSAVVTGMLLGLTLAPFTSLYVVAFGGASAVNQDVVPYTLAEGNKARAAYINIVGLKRRGFTEEEILILRDSYKIIFKKKLKLEEALQQLEEKYGTDKNVVRMIEFIRKSKRGITR